MNIYQQSHFIKEVAFVLGFLMYTQINDDYDLLFLP